MAAKSDVLVENYVPGKLKAMGLDYDCLKEINPRLIYCSITGFGSNGPYANRAGMDLIAASIGGLLSITGSEGGEPAKVGVAITDMGTGLYANSAILAALIQRSQTNVGCKIDTNLLSAQVSLLTNVGTNYINAGLIARRRGTAHETIAPYQSFKCKDGGYITVAGTSEHQFAVLCRILGLPDLPKDDRFTSNTVRVENRSILIQILSEKFATKTQEEWLKDFEGSGIPYGPVNEMDQVFADEQVKHNKCVIEIDDEEQNQRYKVLGPAIKFDERLAIRPDILPPPQLGQHTHSVLRELLNYTDVDIERLRAEKAIN